MPLDRFINERKTAWQRLEDLLRLVDRMSLRRLHREEVRELGRIYRRTASDLAIARAESRDPRLINYLNSLVIRAHGRIYRADAQGIRRIRNFFARDFPQTFRRTWRYTAVACMTFLIFGLIGFLATHRDPEFSEFAYVSSRMRGTIEAREHWWERINRANQVESTDIFTHNIKVTFYAFALGGILGLGTLFSLAVFGANTGAILSLTYHAGFGNDLVRFMVGHGVVELSCVFIAAAGGLLIGSAMLMPGDLSRGDALKSRGLDAIRLVVGCVPLLVLAGIIEGFISPAPISPAIKITIGAITGVALYSYLLLAGREKVTE